MNSNSNIFNKNIKKKFKLIPFNISDNSLGETRYSPASSKE